MLKAAFLIVALGSATAFWLTDEPKLRGFDGPEELGRVTWLRDFAKAKEQAKAEGRPILLLFQEVPG